MTTQHPDTDPASPELEARAAAGPHRHWSPFDLKLEGSRFQRLHELVSSRDFDETAASEVMSQILAFARGYGDGQADSFLYEYGGMSEDEFEDNPVASIARDGLLSSYDELEYFDHVSKSNRILTEAAATPEAKTFVRDLTLDALDAFCRGRDGRLEESVQAEEAKP